MRSLVTSIFLYACESWTLTAELQRRIQAMEMKCYRKILRISYKDTSAVLFNGSIGDWFRTTVGVRQGCLLSPTLFNILLKRIMTDALEDHEGTDSIGGRTITNLRFADDTDGLAGEGEELAKLTERLDKAAMAYGMEISAE